ncbi:MAG: hypothetical protein VR74_06460 [Hyphomonas sp. BRH_c22]|uniref:hypothetical protein n=1 Tax=Hyphomonas sp. BRH_c22 TaxID=1629710 RepID=UPI0005F15C0B|nr:hypothetical protein [Hyphomonas sp. BRH_c22]KJS38168.1 MAG: hypothetical protein VR74_06460 [Hyphomonas sp. BRH_c22]
MSDEAGFEGEIVMQPPVNAGAPETTGRLTARFVRYPGCQQITLWLPQDGHSGYGKLRILGPGGALIEAADITARLNGRVQILIDTFPWPPGDYAIEIAHAEGWRHVLRLEKLETGAPSKPEPAPEPEPASGPIVYRDGAGNIIPDEDLALRARLQDRLVSQFGRHLEFDGTFRAGTITYVDGAIRIPFSHEMCGGGVHFSIDLPTPE